MESLPPRRFWSMRADQEWPLSSFGAGLATVPLAELGAPTALNNDRDVGSVMPATCAGVKTEATEVDPDPRVLSSSQCPKKKVWSFQIGPPIVNPPWFCTNLVVGPGMVLPEASVVVLKKSRALKKLFWWNSYRLPWKPFVPLLVTICTWEPELRPNSASKLLVMILNSCTPS